MIISDGLTSLPTADVCIVGAGPVGLALAFKLETLGRTVLVLESGPSAPSLGLTEFTAGNHAQPALSTSRGIGGTSALWGGRCVPFDDLDFEQRSHVPYSGWPIPHSSVSRHYADAARFLQAGEVGLPPGRGGGEEDEDHEGFTLDAVETWSRKPAIAPLYEPGLIHSQKITLVTGAAVTGLVLGENGRVKALRLDGRGDVPMPNKVVLAAGGLETARLLLALQGEHPALLGGSEGPLGRFYQGHLTGYLAVAHLEDGAVIRKLSFASDGHGHRSRRRLQPSERQQASEELLNIVFWLDAISISDPSHGSGRLSLLYLILKFTGTYGWLSQGLAPRSGPTKPGEAFRHLRNLRLRDASPAPILRMLRHLWNDGERGMLMRSSGRFLLRYHAEQAPNAESRVRLRDGAEGASTLQVDYRVEDRDIVSVIKSHQLLDEWLRAKGYGRLEYLQPDEERFRSVLAQAFDGYHQIGLARMSEDPGLGVVDKECRVHGIDNLYLAGASVFPTGGHANPTLPAVALALRLAEHLAGVTEQARPAATMQEARGREEALPHSRP